MSQIKDLLIILISSSLVSNVVLSQFLGLLQEWMVWHFRLML